MAEIGLFEAIYSARSLRRLKPDPVPEELITKILDAAFLAFSKAAGNDLSTPVPAFGFPGLKPGDCWCLCAERWKEAFDAGKAPKVRLTATHEATLEVVSLELLKRHAIDLS